MSDELIQQAAKLMQEQAGAFARLDTACAHLSAALVSGEPRQIESLTRAGEGEMLKMRSRLLRLMSSLTAFADARAAKTEGGQLSAESRELFETASAELLRAATGFARTQERCAVLANSGSTLASACIQMCGAQPTTYRAPYARRGEAGTWA